MQQSLTRVIEFMQGAEQLKSTLRTAWTASGRVESTAEHSWRLSLLALVLSEHYPHLDSLKILKLCIIHDLAEAVSGDIPATAQVCESDKRAIEQRDMQMLLAPLEEPMRAHIYTLWEEYDGGLSEEAKLVKALDKLETIMQHNQGANPADFDFEFNLEYGKKWTEFDGLTQQLRALLDSGTRSNMDV